MQYTKPMIDQVFQIRKALPDHLRPHIKLANPNLLDLLAEVYQQLPDAPCRSLIQQLMTMAGPDWLLQLEPKPPESPEALPAPPAVTASTRIYRGQVLPD